MIANFTQFEAWFRCRQGSHKHPSANLLPFFPSFSLASLLQLYSVTFTAGIENRFAQRAIIFGVMLHISFDGHAWQIRKHATGVSHRNGQTVLDWIFDLKYWPFYESLIFPHPFFYFLCMASNFSTVWSFPIVFGDALPSAFHVSNIESCFI